MLTRRDFIKWSATAGAWLCVSASGVTKFLDAAYASIAGGTLDPALVPKYMTPLLIPPVMPKAATIARKGRDIDYYGDLGAAAAGADPAGRVPQDDRMGLRISQWRG